MLMQKVGSLWRRFRSHKKRNIILIAGELLVILIAVQLLYPTNKLLPFETINGLDFSGWDKSDAVKALNENFERDVTIGLYFDESDIPYLNPKPNEFGYVIDNEVTVSGLSYPWYIRLIPTSIIWGHYLTRAPEPSYSLDREKAVSYIVKAFGEDCRIVPSDADIEVENGELKIIDGVAGGTCNIDELKSYIYNFDINSGRIKLPVKAELPDIMTSEANMLADEIESKISKGIELSYESGKISVPKSELVNWLVFDNSGASMSYTFDDKKASEYLAKDIESKFKVEPTTTKVTTNDFIELSREQGSDGQTLDVTKTLENIKKYIKGEVNKVEAVISVVPSPVEYTRSYSTTNTGMEALMQNFASSHAGTYGVVLVELGGKQRTASYSPNRQFTTASTYKLFVAYSTLLRIESGEWSWEDANIYGGKNLAKCFDDMIVLSDNECARALMKKIKNSVVTNEAKAIGCSNTSFNTSDYVTTARDLALFLTKLQQGQILSQQSSRDTLISAMKRNVYRHGIPSGTSSIVADKVGFLNALLHDASIVYAPSGTYVLVILTNGSTWGNIASLTQQLDVLISK